MWVQRKVLLNKDITIKNVASHMKYIDIKLVCPNWWDVKNKFAVYPILKWEIVKRCKYKAGTYIVNYVCKEI